MENQIQIIYDHLLKIEKDVGDINRLLVLALANINNGEELLTTVQAASFLQVSKVTIYKWRKEGLLNAVIIGNAVRFKKSHLLGVVTEKRRARRNDR